MRLGIIGKGYVGNAIYTVMKDFYEIDIFDLDKNLSTIDTLEELIKNVGIVFICVPTPMNKNGSCSIEIVESLINDINIIAKKHKINMIVAIKSTVPPGTTLNLSKKYNHVTLLFNPEFLTESNSIRDFRNQDRIIIGGPSNASSKLRQIYSKVFPNSYFVKTDSTTAEMVKYLINTFLATKVSFANEMKLICDNINIDYDKVVEYAIYDSRLGTSHWAVPGPDGKHGFGGSCFPKDLNALIYFCTQNKIFSDTLKAVWNTNLHVRSGRDWEELIGRAIKEED